MAPRLSSPVRRRGPGLTAMIDVVFLLLVFFMLAARFGQDGGIDIPLAGGSGDYDGPPRLVEISAERHFLNGAPVALDDLPEVLAPLMRSPEDLIVLRARAGADVQRLVDVVEVLTASGLSAVTVVE